MMSQAAAILDFEIFRFFSNLNLILKMVRKQHLAIEIYKIATIYCKVSTNFIVKLSVFSNSFSKKLKFQSQHTNYISYYGIKRCNQTKINCTNESSW